MTDAWTDDPRSTEELLEAHRRERQNDDPDWRALWAIRKRGGRHEFELGCRLTSSAASSDREIGADLLAQLGGANLVFQEEVVSILIRLLDDPDLGVVRAAAVGLGHRRASEAIAPLVALSLHEDARVRAGAVFGLLTQDDPCAIAAMIRLSADSDLDTRDWAMFGLGSMVDADMAELREALVAGLSDPEPVVRGEALLGLAFRHDGRALEALTRELERADCVVLALEAAEFLADRSILPLLERQLTSLAPDEDGRFREQLLRAIAACRTGGPPT